MKNARVHESLTATPPVARYDTSFKKRSESELSAAGEEEEEEARTRRAARHGRDVRDARGRRFTVEVWYFATVREMKERICVHEGVPVESQRLFFEGRELDDDGRDAEHYSILHGSRVLLVLPDDDPSSSSSSLASAAVHVVVSVPSLGCSIALDLRASDTVARLKELLEECAGGALPAARVTVLFDKAEMEDGKALEDYSPPVDGIMKVCAVVRQPPAGNAGGKSQQTMAVMVKWCTKTVVLEVSATDAVRELRRELERVAPQLGPPERDGYFLAYKQNAMDKDRTLRCHEVKSGDTMEIFNGSVTGGA